jgi:hypothetical protein
MNHHEPIFSVQLSFLWRNSYVGRLFESYLHWANTSWARFLDKPHFSIQWNFIVEGLLILVLTFMPVLSARTIGESWRFLIPLVLLLWMMNPAQNNVYVPQSYRAGLAFLWLILAVSTFFNSGFGNGMAVLLGLSSWFILAWIVGRVFTKENSERILKYLTFSSVIWLVIGFWQLFSGMVTPRGWLGLGQADIIPVRIYSVFGNPNIFALYLVSILVFSHYFRSKCALKMERVVLSGIFLAVLTALYFTYARMAWMIAGVWLAFQLKNWWRYGFLIAGVGLIILFFIPGFTIRIKRLVFLSDSSLWYRIQIWRGVWRALQDYWLWGAGPGSFQLIYPQYQLGRIVSRHAHQLYLQFWLEYGLFSLLAFMAVMKRILTRARACFRIQRKPPLIIPLTIALIIFLVYGFSETWYIHSFCGGYFWFLTGLLLSVKKYSNSDKIVTDQYKENL